MMIKKINVKKIVRKFLRLNFPKIFIEKQIFKSDYAYESKTLFNQMKFTNKEWKNGKYHNPTHSEN